MKYLLASRSVPSIFLVDGSFCALIPVSKETRHKRQNILFISQQLDQNLLPILQNWDSYLSRSILSYGMGRNPSHLTFHLPSLGIPGLIVLHPSYPAHIKATAASSPPLPGK